MASEYITEMKIGNTLFIVCAEHSETATETAEQKLKRLINSHIYDAPKVINKLSDITPNLLDMSENQR